MSYFFPKKNQVVGGTGLVGWFCSTGLSRILAAYSLFILPLKNVGYINDQKCLKTKIGFKQLDERKGKERSCPFSLSSLKYS